MKFRIMQPSRALPRCRAQPILFCRLLRCDRIRHKRGRPPIHFEPHRAQRFPFVAGIQLTDVVNRTDDSRTSSITKTSECVHEFRINVSTASAAAPASMMTGTCLRSEKLNPRLIVAFIYVLTNSSEIGFSAWIDGIDCFEVGAVRRNKRG